MTSSAQLEREAEGTRAQLAQTLDELRERITPGQLVDQAVDYAKDSGGGLFVRNLGRQTIGNPLPVALIGVGMAWLMLANGRRSSSAGLSRESAIDRARRAAIDSAARMADASQSAGARMSEWASETAEGLAQSGRRFRDQASEQVRDLTDRAHTVATEGQRDADARAGGQGRSVGEAAASMYESATSRAADEYGRMSDAATQAASSVGQSMSSFGRSTANSASDLLQFCKSQPLVLAGIGMALGAILGAFIPATETEDRLMGETSDQMKDRARDAAKDQIERAQAATKSATETALSETDKSQPDHSDTMPAETSLVPDAEYDAEQPTSNEATEHER